MDNFNFGLWCETQAMTYLESVKGWRLLERRARFREGEIDLIMQSPEGLVFVEVKGLRSVRFGAVVEHVTTEKIRRLKRAIWRWRERRNCGTPGRLLFLGVTVKENRVFFEELPME